MNNKNRTLGLEIIRTKVKKDSGTHIYLNKLCELSDLKNKDIAAYLGIKDSKLSAYKKGTTSLSNIGWSCVRHFFHHYFTYGEISSAVYLGNKDRVI